MRASDQWQWQYNETDERLTIVLSEELVHHVPYSASKLVAMIGGEFAFDCDDAEQFQQAYDYLEAVDALAPVTVMATALNVSAWARFGRPQMPQSWHFQQADSEALEAAVIAGETRLCELNSGFTKGLFYIIEADEEFAVCMLLDKQMAVSDIKNLKQFDTVKVLLNRLQPAAIDPIDTRDSFNSNFSHKNTA